MTDMDYKEKYEKTMAILTRIEERLMQGNPTCMLHGKILGYMNGRPDGIGGFDICNRLCPFDEERKRCTLAEAIREKKEIQKYGALIEHTNPKEEPYQNSDPPEFLELTS